jgi:hypothetical protein
VRRKKESALFTKYTDVGRKGLFRKLLKDLLRFALMEKIAE